MERWRRENCPVGIESRKEQGGELNVCEDAEQIMLRGGVGDDEEGL